MTPGGTVELIWHFAGYLHLVLEDLRARDNYNDGPRSHLPDDYTVKLPHFEYSPDLDPFNTYGLPSPLLPFEPESFRVQITPHRLARLPIDLDRVKVPTHHDSLKHPLDTPDVAGMRQIEVVYENSSDRTLFQIDQLNRMSDDDQFGLSQPVDVEEIHGFDIEARLEQFEAQAAAEIPEAIAAPHSSAQALAEFIGEQNALKALSDTEAQNDDGDHASPIVPGLYINGELQPEGTERPQEPVVEEQPVDLDAKGQWATLGENIVSNAAVIVDLSEAAPTLMVLGDFFSTNGIVQVNIFTDDDSVEHAGMLPKDIITNGNTADNIAEIIKNDGVHGALAGNFSGWSWHVDVVDGDFFDTNLLVQKNYLSDNDVTAQDSSATHFQLVAGENGLQNFVDFYNDLSKYDVIIVGGNYHGANLIFQTNILLDDDILKLVAGGDGTSQQFAFGDENALLNDATIVTYGNNNFQSFTPQLDALVAALANQQTTLDPSYGTLVPGNGPGPLDVLYITGDYYDINALWQVNVVADLDLAMQLLSGAPPQGQGPDLNGAPPEGSEGFTQSAETGANSLSNLAGIVDAGSTFTFVKGAPYEDTILVQANLVADDKDTVVSQDPNALVSEVVAFMGDDNPETEHTDTKPPLLHPSDDVMGSVLT